MKKIFVTSALIGLFAAGPVHAGGYRIPEQSVNSLARAGAYVAYTPNADASYFNPANMSWLEDRGLVDVNLIYINLPSVTYTDDIITANNGESKEEHFFLPAIFAVSPDYSGFRIGFSLAYPGGLAKQWDQSYPKTFAEEFSLKVIELGSSVSYKFCDKFSLGGGVRVIYSEATVQSDGQIDNTLGGVFAGRDMDGDTWELGFNLAASVRPVKESNISVTYRSMVDLGFDGTADLWRSIPLISNEATYKGPGSVEVPLPAVLTIAGSYTFFDQLTVELEYDRTYWSEYEHLDFIYPTPLADPILYQAFDDPKRKDWKDTDSWRISVSYDVNDALTLMAGFAIDENPIPDATLGFDLPDSDARLYSLGFRYRVSERLDVGAAYLYDDKDSRSVTNDYVNGTFDDGGAHLVSVGFSYTL
ncbi:OmpP1/FadL family transporter [Desulfolithobacter sp.]